MKIFFSFTFISAVGAGAVRGNLIAFGADQTQGAKMTSHYIDKFVVAINLASMMTTLGAIYVTDYSGIEQYFHFYIMAVSMLFMAFLLFLIGWRFYMHVEPHDSVLVNCIPVIRNAFVTWRQSKKNQLQIEQIQPTEDVVEGSSRIEERSSTFFDYAKIPNHGKFQDRIVDDVKALRNTLVVSFLIIPYWCIFYQVG